MNGLRVLVAVCAAVLTIRGAPARAGEPRRKRPPAPARTVRLEELKVEGRLRRPEATSPIPRTNLGGRALERPEPLLPKVTRAVEREPF